MWLTTMCDPDIGRQCKETVQLKNLQLNSIRLDSVQITTSSTALNRTRQMVCGRRGPTPIQREYFCGFLCCSQQTLQSGSTASSKTKPQSHTLHSERADPNPITDKHAFVYTCLFNCWYELLLQFLCLLGNISFSKSISSWWHLNMLHNRDRSYNKICDRKLQDKLP